MDAACSHACPHLGGSDRRCACRWTLDHLDEAFTYCLGAFRHCPVYTAIAVEEAGRRRIVGFDDADLQIDHDGDCAAVRRVVPAMERARPSCERRAAVAAPTDAEFSHERRQRIAGVRSPDAVALPDAVARPQVVASAESSAGRGAIHRGLRRLGLLRP